MSPAMGGIEIIVFTLHCLYATEKKYTAGSIALSLPLSMQPNFIILRGVNLGVKTAGKCYKGKRKGPRLEGLVIKGPCYQKPTTYGEVAHRKP